MVRSYVCLRMQAPRYKDVTSNVVIYLSDLVHCTISKQLVFD
jgi:hypothetical protein